MFHARLPRASRRRALPCCAIAVSLALTSPAALAQSAPGPAADAPRSWNLPAAPLADTLARIARDGGRRLSADPALIAGKTAAPVHGSFTSADAARHALSGTGLELILTDSGTLSLRPVPVSAPAPGAREGAATLAPVKVTAGALRSPVTEQSASYGSRDVSMAKGQALREIPQSVSVITRQQMDDQNMITLDQVMAYMPGVTVGGLGLGGRGNAYYTRGLSANTLQFDGVAGSGLMPSGLNLEGSNVASMAMYDHVEVLRGADGLYGGLGDSSGTINLVRKRPLRDTQVKVSASAGSWDTYQTEADLAGPLAFDGKLRGRVVFVRRDARYFTEHAYSRSDFIYAIGELDLGERSTLTLGGNYGHDRGTPQGGELTRNGDGSDPGFPRRSSLVAPWSTFQKENTAAFAEFRHDFDEAWQANASVNYTRSGNSRYYAVIGQAADSANIRVRGGGYPGETWSWDVHLKGKGRLLDHAYDLLLGADGRSSEMDYDFRWNFTYAGAAYNRASVADPLHVDWALYPRPLAFARDGLGHLTEKQKSAYGRVKLEVVDALHVILGGRYSNYDYAYAYANYDTAGQPTSSSLSRYDQQGIFTPYGGLVYDLGAHWSTYASVAKVFRSQASALKGPPPGGSIIDPLEGRNYELGVKGELAGGRLTTALALYRLERTGESVRDTRYDFYSSGGGASCCFLNKGEVISQGIDAEIQGEILPRLQVSASYVFNRISDKTEGSVAYNTTVAPRHLLKLWSRFQLAGEWSRLAVGGGMTAQSRTYAQGSNYYYQQGGYALLNLFAQYQLDRYWQVGLNLNNALDRKYYASITDPTYGNYYGEPFNWTLSLRGTF